MLLHVIHFLDNIIKYLKSTPQRTNTKFDNSIKPLAAINKTKILYVIEYNSLSTTKTFLILKQFNLQINR